jgi:Cdc6-like AAA superfamily ATPase
MDKATVYTDIPRVVRFQDDIDTLHPFYVDFSGVRGNFNEQTIYKELNFNPIKGEYKPIGSIEPTTLFFMGQKGSGKTTELRKYVGKLDSPTAYYCVYCSVEKNLNLNDLELSDVALYMIESLAERLQKDNVKVDSIAMNRISNWFDENIREKINEEKLGVDLETGISTETGIPFIAKFFAKLRGFYSSTESVKKTIRETVVKNFSDFAYYFSDFVNVATDAIRKQGLGLDILLVADGIEKAMSRGTSEKIFIHEISRIVLLKANVIYGFPFYLKKQLGASEFVKIVRFPVIKIQDKNGEYNYPKAMEKLKEMIYRRIDASLFENDKTVEYIVKLSGGHPRNLLRIIREAYNYGDYESEKIMTEHVTKGATSIAKTIAQTLEKKHLNKLQDVANSNIEGREVIYDEVMDELIQQEYLYEYNDCTYVRANPILSLAPVYQEYVAHENITT